MQRRHRTASSALALAALVLIALPAAADVLNGDFENGGADWTVSTPAMWSGFFPATGGNPDGYAAIRSPFGDSGGLGCISQTFMCGQPDGGGTCTITFDFRLEQIDASNDTGRILLVIDGATTLVTDVPGDWQTFTFTVPCGEHTIELCLEVDPGNNGWVASFDNVRAECDGVVRTEGQDWSALKGLFR